MTTVTSDYSVRLRAARAAGIGLGAFNVVLLEHAEAIVEGAGASGHAVVLQISENCATYHGALTPLVLACRALADRASVPAYVHLDHVESVELVHLGLELGVDSIMFDASKLDYADNLAATRAVADLAHQRGIAVEAELGEVGGKDGVHAPGARTDPEEAVTFAIETGVDALAVAVGTSHAMTTRDSAVDRRLITELAASVPVPLVLHGSSGLPDEELQAAVAAGMTKINIATHLNALFTRAIRDRLAADPGLVEPRRYIRDGRRAVADEVARLLSLLAD